MKKGAVFLFILKLVYKIYFISHTFCVIINRIKFIMRYYTHFYCSAGRSDTNLTTVIQAVRDAALFVFNQFTSLGFFDLADIIIVSVLFYYLYKFVRERRAGKLAIGILFILVIMMLSSLFNMNALNFIISNIVQVGIIGVIILFQAELRSFLEKVGGESIKSITSRKDNGVMSEMASCIGIIADAVFELSAEKTGALIVIERSTKLGDVIKTGTVVNANPSAYLIRNIFFNKSPLHDGAMVIRDCRIFAAGCFLPLSQDETIIKTLGTRHRAAIGMSENSDAAVVVVSEETGTVSVAIDGHLIRGLSKGDLISKLEELLIGENEPSESNARKTIDKLGRILPKNTPKDKSDKTYKKGSDNSKITYSNETKQSDDNNGR